MADIFISYSQADRDLVVRLAAMLEAEGWTVWWDTSLIPGDDFRNVIMAELAKARAAIVVWTDASVKSDWVRSEAGRAQMDRKLIPVKLAHLGYKDLPPPFDVLHTEAVDNHAAIKAAVVGQLAKPEVTPNTWWVALKTLRYQALTWVGIVTGALTLFAGASGLVHLAEWSRWLVSNWRSLTHGFWNIVFHWLGWSLPSPLVPIVTLCAASITIATSEALRRSSVSKAYSPSNFRHNPAGVFVRLVIGAPCLWLLAIFFFAVFSAGIGKPMQNQSAAFALVVAIMFLLLTGPHFLLVLLMRQRAMGLVTVFLCWMLGFVLALQELMEMNQNEALKEEARYLATQAGSLYLGILSWLLPAVMISIAPVRALLQRLIFLFIGFALLLLLNEISKIDIPQMLRAPPHIVAPMIQGTYSASP